jgi:hypothetical protein
LLVAMSRPVTGFGSVYRQRAMNYSTRGGQQNYQHRSQSNCNRNQDRPYCTFCMKPGHHDSYCWKQGHSASYKDIDTRFYRTTASKHQNNQHRGQSFCYFCMEPGHYYNSYRCRKGHYTAETPTPDSTDSNAKTDQEVHVIVSMQTARCLSK